ncbi:MAG TPA: thioredoxin domain-containing protein [Candidatus Paceibacterota bacterium]|jgi:protein-disulfide isomerase|nr:thioredoxin domain-containing protein [Candidatus Paceibacterota bacterium]
MNTKRIIFWACFIIILGLIFWGLVVAMNKPTTGSIVGTPAPVTSEDHILGPKNAPVTMIEYGDFQCPACGAYFPLVKRLTQEASTTLRLVFRHFPLPQHANAPITAQASEAAALQGKFWEMYDMIYGNQSEWSDLPDAHAVMYSYAQKIGLDMVKFKADLDSNAVKQSVSDDQAEGDKIGINATPTFFVNGKIISNPQSYEAFKALIEAAASGSSK